MVLLEFLVLLLVSCFVWSCLCVWFGLSLQRKFCRVRHEREEAEKDRYTLKKERGKDDVNKYDKFSKYGSDSAIFCFYKLVASRANQVYFILFY